MQLRTRLALPAVALAAAALAAGCGASSITIHGKMAVSPDSPGCDLSDSGYSDVQPGAQVTVTAPDGTVIGSGALGSPKSSQGGFLCTFPFTVTGVQGGEPRYGIAVSHRGTVWYSPSEVGHAALSLG